MAMFALGAILAVSPTATAQGDASISPSTLTVSGLVTIRQRPGSANGVIFMTLEDETGRADLIDAARLNGNPHAGIDNELPPVAAGHLGGRIKTPFW